MLKHTGRGSALVAVIIAICILSVRDLSQDLRLGIDLQGGTELLYRIDLDLVPAASQDSASEDFKRIISNRLDRFGLKELSIAPVGRDRLLIQLPGADRAELERMKRQVEDAGELSFHLVSDDEYQTPEVIAGIEEEMKAYEEDLRRYNIDQRKPAAEREGLSLPQPLVRLAVVGRVERDPTDTGPPPTPPKHVVENGPSLKVSGDELTNASPTIDRFGTPAVGFEFSGKGAAIFSDLTGNNVGKSLAIVLDGVAQSVATIQSRINGPGQLTGSFTDTQVRDIVTILKAGSLPVKPELVHEQTIGAVLGRDSVERGTQAMLIAFVLVVLFMFAYYLVPGIVANIALFLNLLLLLACMVAFRNTLTFPGMAGLLLTVGMAVDANILIFERIREEKARGRALRKAVEVGYQRAFWTIFDANLTTLITAYILFQFGTGAIKGFAVVLSIGIIASFFTALYVSRLVISLLLKSGLVKELRMLRLFEKPNIDFLQHRKVFTSTSVGLIILGLGFLVVRGQESLGIDFTGGARIIAKLQTPATEVQIRDLIRGISGPDGKAMFADVQIQSIEEEVEGGARKARAFSIRTRQIGSQAQAGAARAQGPGTGGSPTEVFKARVEETLRGADLLAPAPFIDSQITGGSESE
ncbi:MAG: protein translocase subunit SecD, partial [Planctomycetota bacterium]